MNNSTRYWIHGLGAATIGGAANAVTVIVLDPLKFNLQDGWKNLLAAVVVSGVLSVALYLKQSPLPDERPRFTGIIKILALFFGLLCFSGCSTLSDYQSLPVEQRAEFLRKQTVAWLKENPQTIKTALVLAGTGAMQYAVDDAERAQLSEKMWTVSTAFYTLATGQAVSVDELNSTLDAFSAGPKPKQYAVLIAQVSTVWAAIYPKLKLSGDAELAKMYACVFAEAAQEVAKIYRP